MKNKSMLMGVLLTVLSISACSNNDTMKGSEDAAGKSGNTGTETTITDHTTSGEDSASHAQNGSPDQVHSGTSTADADKNTKNAGTHTTDHAQKNAAIRSDSNVSNTAGGVEGSGSGVSAGGSISGKTKK